MVDPSRQHWWREIVPVFALLAAAMAGLGALSAYRNEAPSAQAPEIVYGELREFRRGSTRHLPDGPYLLVSFPDRSMRYLKVGDRDDRGCRIGSRVAVERRGSRLSLAPTVCPDQRDRAR
jgi:hypothetical protein